MLYYKKLGELIYSKERFESATHVAIISGFVGWQPLLRMIEEFPDRKITLIYGMYAQNKVSSSLHKALLDIVKAHSDRVDILYSQVPVHSKIYFWKDNGALLGGYIGSANFSANGLNIDYKESLEDIEIESFEKWEKYYSLVRENSIPITDKSIKTVSVKKENDLKLEYKSLIDKNVCRVSLLIKKNGSWITPQSSGINWGFQKGHSSKQKTEAYIPIHSNHRKDFPSFFPEKKFANLNAENPVGKSTRHEEQFEVIWDDGTTMLCVMEGDSKDNGVIYPKQISSSPSKKILGEYIRKRMKYKNNVPISKEDLINYGRTHIDIQLLDDGTYYFDFSVKK